MPRPPCSIPPWERVLTADSVRALEKEAAAAPYQLAMDKLMETAGLRVAEVFANACATDTEVVILVGPGNNGGDALVAAKHLKNWAYKVHCFQYRTDDIETFKKLISTSKKIAIIDGLFGIGFKGRLPESLIGLLNFCKGLSPDFCLAIDVPSGLPSSDLGSLDSLNDLLPADITITFAAKKPAHILAPTRHLCGEVRVVDIGFPADLLERYFDQQVPRIAYCPLHRRPLQSPFSSLTTDSHKYDRGHVLLIGGSPGLGGAAILAALATIRAGAGWVSLALSPDCRGEKPVPYDLPLANAIWKDDGTIDVEQLAHYVEHRKVRSIVIGCGMIAKELSADLVAYLRDFVNIYKGFVTLDAGALYGADRWLGLFKADGQLSRHLLLLPHPGEWRQMFQIGSPPGEFRGSQDFRLAAAWLKRYQLAVIYKSASPVYIDGETGNVFVHNLASRVLAKAGSGDVLAGICGAFACQVMDCQQLVQTALTYLCAAADDVVKSYGYDGAMASDLIESLGRIQAISSQENR